MKIGDTFRLTYCQKVTLKLKRIDKIHRFQMQDESDFSRKENEVDPLKNGWEQI